MTRVSSYNMMYSNTSGLLKAQSNLEKVQNQSATEKVATDLKGYGSSSSRLVNTQTVIDKLDERSNTLKILSSRADIEEISYDSFTDSITNLREALTNALGNDTGVGLQEVLEASYANTASAANTQFDGQYIFSGVSGNVQPYTANSLVEASQQTDTDDYWSATGETRKVTIGDGNVVEISKGAEEVFRPFLDLMTDIQKWQNDNASFDGKLNDDQKAYISSKLEEIKTIQTNAINYQSIAGSVQNQIENKIDENTNQQNVLSKVRGGIVDVDMAEIATKLTAAQTQYKTMAEIFSQMKSISLLDYLS